MLPDGEAARRQRIRSIRHHFLGLIEAIPEELAGDADSQPTANQVRAIKRTLKRLMKSDITRWDGGGTFRINQVAKDWMIGDRTLRRHLSQARDLGLIETAVDADQSARRRTTIEFNWRAIARLVGTTVLPEQPAMVTEQPAMVTEQPAMVTEQPAMVAGYSGTGKSVAPASTRGGRGWSAAVAAILEISPDLNLACIESARNAGCTATETIAIAEHWRSQGGAWGVGALFCRIRRAMPGVPADQGWPARRSSSNQRIESREQAIYRISREALRNYQARPGLTIDQVCEERDRIVADALLRAGILEAVT